MIKNRFLYNLLILSKKLLFFYTRGWFWHFLFCKITQQVVEKPAASVKQILESRFKVTSVPRIGNLSSACSKGHHHPHFSDRIIVDNTVKPAYIAFVHANQQIEFVIVISTYLPCSFTVFIPMLPSRNTLLAKITHSASVTGHIIFFLLFIPSYWGI